MSSQNTRSQVKANGNGASLTARWFILNIYVKHTKFICSVDFISRRGMVPILSMNIYDSERCNVIHSNSCMDVFYHTNNLITGSPLLYDISVVLYKQKKKNEKKKKKKKKNDFVMVPKKIGRLFYLFNCFHMAEF